MSSISAAGYLEPGTLVVGNYRYQIINEVGRGAMAVVYLAKQVDLQRPVALKVLSGELSSNRSFVKRFFNEVRTAAALSHPNIIQAYDAGIANDDIYYFAMEYVNGETLLERITREQRLKVPAALRYASEIASALNYGWQRQRLTHGDIKPDNIMVNDLDQAKLADFGLAKVTGHDYDGHELMLTPHYASPELINGQHPKDDCRADIYAFGASLYHLLAGSPPYPGNDGQEVMRRHVQEELEPLSQRQPSISHHLSEFIGKLMAKAPRNRPADWNAVLEGLSRCEKNLASGSDERKIVFKLSADPARGKLPVGAGPVAAAAAAAAASALPVSSQSKASGRTSAWWLFTIVFATLLLLFFGYLYWRKLSARQAGADSGVTVTYTEPVESASSAAALSPAAGQVGPASPTVVQDSAKNQVSGLADNGAQIPVQQLPADQLVELPDESDEPVEPLPLSIDAAVTVKEGAQGNITLPKSDPTIPNRSRRARYPDYALKPAFTMIQLKNFSRLQAWNIFASYRHIPGQVGSAERMMSVLNEWLLLYGNGSTESELVSFVKTDVIPLLDEGPAKLALNKNAVIGQTFRSRGRKNIQLIIRDVYPDGLLADWQLEKGTMQRRVTWRELEDSQPNILLEMYKVVFFDNSVTGNPEFYLAQLVFSNYAKLYQQAMQEFARMNGKNRSKWERLGEMVSISDPRDREALKLLAELPRYCALGSRVEAGRVARRLLSINSPLGNEYRDLPEAVLAVCGKYLPEMQGGLLVRQAQDIINDNPDEALAMLNAANVLYGQVKFPEREQIAKLQSRAHRRLADNFADSGELTLATAWPFVNPRPAARWPFYGYAQTALLEKAGAVNKSELAALRTFVDLEVGNWPRPSEALPPLLAEIEVPLTRSVALYASWLQELRKHNRTFPESAEFLRGLPNEQFGNLGRALLAELCLLSRAPTMATQGVEKIFMPLNFWFQGEPENLAKHWRIILTLLLETERLDDAKQLLEMGQKFLSEHSLAGPLQKELQWVGSLLQASPAQSSLAGQLLLPDELLGSEYQLRLGLAALQQRQLNSAGDTAMLALYSEAASGYRQVGGDALFDWLLRRVAWHLQNGDVRAAFGLCEKIQERRLSCLFAYLPRIYFLQAGLLLLNGQTAGLTDVCHALRFGSMASENLELRVLELPKTNDAQVGLGKINKEDEPYFWFEWLKACQSLDITRRDSAAAVRLDFSHLSCFNAEKTLLAGLEDYSRTYLQKSSGKEK